MSVCYDDELFLTYVTERLEAKSDSSGNLFGYESNNDVEVENESDSDIEADWMGACLNSVEFTILNVEKFRLLKRMIFADVDAFRKVLYEYNIQWGFPLIRDKNEKLRVTAYYGNYGCEWREHTSSKPDGVTFMVKTCIPDHTCVMSENIIATAKWMANKIVDILRADTNVSTNVLRNELTKYGSSPSDMQLYRAKQKAMDIIDGSHAEGYSLLPKYYIMLMNTIPGSIAKI
ncbi:hypothetical protein ACH5RR_008888 [Cinchona calisaya]|uniref:Transposase MuDR plant domain-containing protein n=1 Tax=Cinchona calisaya TaxID=153742 RepID=A0ABD3ACR5_9GENT